VAYAFEYEKSAHLMWLPEKLVDLAANITKEVEGVGQRQHFSHQHDLILSNEELVEDMLCDDCLHPVLQLYSMQFISPQYMCSTTQKEVIVFTSPTPAHPCLTCTLQKWPDCSVVMLVNVLAMILHIVVTRVISTLTL